AAAGSSSTLKPQPAEKYRDGTLLKFVVGKDVDFILDRPDSIPVGYASVWSERGDQFKAVLVKQSADQTIDVPMFVATDLPEDEAAIQAGLFYRGMRRSGRIAFKALTGGKRTVFTLPQYGPPLVRVVRENPEPERLLLVLDCSLSMRAETPNGMSRLAVAQNAVSEFLDGLDADVEVGLIVFGDRYGFEEEIDPATKKPIIRTVQDDGKAKLRVIKFDEREVKPAGLIVPDERVPHNPNFDVRVGVPINPLDNPQLAAIKKQIANLGAIGTTPTYLAIQKAYEQLGRRRGHIIVLTDGKPNVISTKNVSVEDSRQAALTDYQTRKKDIRLTIVKYLDSDSQLSKDFQGADVLSAANGKDLITHLKNVRSKPQVVWERNRQEASIQGAFEALVAISEWPPAGVATLSGQPVLPAESFSIRATVPDSSRPVDESSDVKVEGGEQFEMTLAESGLMHRPFDYQFTQLQAIPTTLSDASRFVVSAGPISKRENRQLTMQLAIESASGGRGNGKFSPRPSDVWVELTGIDSRRSSRSSKETYTFSLPEFQVRQPIPILLCRIDDFAQEYDKVEVKAWLRFGEERLAGVAIPTESGEAFTSGELPGVSFRTQRVVNAAGGIRLTVTEQYGEQREPGSVRVLPSPLPNNASTVLYDDKRVVTRTFDFDNADVAITLSAIAASELKEKSTLAAEGTVEIDFDSR
ncbi:MAG: VWA domain-containing protein, partial [Planctomycetales bacterium]|nr:VWA domain-containing protein [Planctomycetales bacterium]